MRTFQRLGVPDNTALESGRLDIDRLEIARLDNDRNFAERGAADDFAGRREMSELSQTA